jgi:hypothetical protein
LSWSAKNEDLTIKNVDLYGFTQGIRDIDMDLPSNEQFDRQSITNITNS